MLMQQQQQQQQAGIMTMGSQGTLTMTGGTMTMTNGEFGDN